MPKWVIFRQNDSLIKENLFSRKNRQNEDSVHKLIFNLTIFFVKTTNFITFDKRNHFHQDDIDTFPR